MSISRYCGLVAPHWNFIPLTLPHWWSECCVFQGNVEYLLKWKGWPPKWVENFTIALVLLYTTSASHCIHCRRETPWAVISWDCSLSFSLYTYLQVQHMGAWGAYSGPAPHSGLWGEVRGKTQHRHISSYVCIYGQRRWNATTNYGALVITN